MEEKNRFAKTVVALVSVNTGSSNTSAKNATDRVFAPMGESSPRAKTVVKLKHVNTTKKKEDV